MIVTRAIISLTFLSVLSHVVDSYVNVPIYKFCTWRYQCNPENAFTDDKTIAHIMCMKTGCVPKSHCGENVIMCNTHNFRKQIETIINKVRNEHVKSMADEVKAGRGWNTAANCIVTKVPDGFLMPEAENITDNLIVETVKCAHYAITSETYVKYDLENEFVGICVTSECYEPTEPVQQIGCRVVPTADLFILVQTNEKEPDKIDSEKGQSKGENKKQEKKPEEEEKENRKCAHFRKDDIILKENVLILTMSHSAPAIDDSFDVITFSKDSEMLMIDTLREFLESKKDRNFFMLQPYMNKIGCARRIFNIIRTSDKWNFKVQIACVMTADYHYSVKSTVESMDKFSNFSKYTKHCAYCLYQGRFFINNSINGFIDPANINSCVKKTPYICKALEWPKKYDHEYYIPEFSIREEDNHIYDIFGSCKPLPTLGSEYYTTTTPDMDEWKRVLIDRLNRSLEPQFHFETAVKASAENLIHRLQDMPDNLEGIRLKILNITPEEELNFTFYINKTGNWENRADAHEPFSTVLHLFIIINFFVVFYHFY